MATGLETPVCPDCGLRMQDADWATGLCPRCLLELAAEVPIEPASELPTVVEPGFPEAPTVQFEAGQLSPGEVKGARYQVRALLGRGGMGEVWRAYDLKLRVDVALKSLRPELLEAPGALEALRREVRAARAVMSPNVCRIFDLVEIDGQELISMEYIDGISLADILKIRAPLELGEAREIAAQFLAGLEAIHEAGLVHRDLKPENIMMTRSGRVVVMDFGIAKDLAEDRDGLIAGTPAYMPPEQARGDGVDARTDVFAAGVVLAEMIAPEGLSRPDARRALWRLVHEEPEALPQTPWSAIVRKATAPAPDRRFASAAALVRALEEVALRVAGAEDVHPYPGLAAFTQEEAEYFFGRELEIEEMWKKLQRPHLLGLIGPSGAGKSSFLRAGLLPVMPTGWQAFMLSPGPRPFVALAQAFASQSSREGEPLPTALAVGDLEAVVTGIADWRQAHDEVLLIVDQFEELFTQSPLEVQVRFAELLGRLALEADVHVLLSMRDDFLFHCHAFEALRPILSELTLLGPPTGTALRRAVVQPALKCGYRFEDDSLVEDMLAEVGGERGALPMLAFAAARLWEHRDRERGLLTREAYEFIGGVGGALAQHAEAVLEEVGEANVPIVRELFRNLVTAQGTRATRDREELLSVFSAGTWVAAPARGFEPPGRKTRRAKAPGPSGDQENHREAARILDTLIDARLLTSYEVAAASDEQVGRTRIEIVHESLLAHWPRLVRWQRQDVDNAQLRDQVRQAAQTWEDRHRSEDLLWTGTAFREYELWRERYEGGLSTTEEEFAAAMTTKARRRVRRRRLVLTAAFAVLLAVLGVVAGLWWRGELARREAVAEARRAEASKLLALGRLSLESNPTEALAYTIASLELADQAASRRFALEALWRGPTAFVLSDQFTWNARFSPDGRWLAAGGQAERLELWSRRGDVPRALAGRRSVPLGFSADSELLITQQKRIENSLRTWSVTRGELLQTQIVEGDLAEWVAYLSAGTQRVITLEVPPEWDRIIWREWPLLEGEAELLGVDPGQFFWIAGCTDPLGVWLGFGTEHEVGALPLVNPSVAAVRFVGRHESSFTGCTVDSERRLLASIDEAGEIRFWSLGDSAMQPVRSLRVGEPAGSRALAFTPDGDRFIAGNTDQVTRIWDLVGPPDADPQTLLRGEIDFVLNLDVHPEGSWLVTAESKGTVLWPMTQQRSYRLVGHTDGVSDLSFTPDSRWLYSSSFDRTVRRWPLSAEVAEHGEVFFRSDVSLERALIQPSGDKLALTSSSYGPAVLHLDGQEPVFLEGMSFGPWALAWDAEGRWVASGGGNSQPADALIRLWDLEGAEIRRSEDPVSPMPYIETTLTLDAGDRKPIANVVFLPDAELLSIGFAGLRRWSIKRQTFIQLTEESGMRLAVTPDQRTAVIRLGSTGLGGGAIQVYNLEDETLRDLPSHGARAVSIALDPSGEILVSGDEEGVVRVSRLDGGDPHLLLGHSGSIQAIAISPDGRWIASGSADKTVRLWPMPDLTRPPLQTLPRNELLARLKTLTNLRAVEDPESDTGWKVEIGPFPGWEEVPEW